MVVFSCSYLRSGCSLLNSNDEPANGSYLKKKSFINRKQVMIGVL